MPDNDRQESPRTWLTKQVVGTAFVVIGGVITAVVIAALKLSDPAPPRPTPTLAPSHATTETEPASAAPVPDHSIIRTGRLTLADGIGWNLDVEPGANAWDQSNWLSGTDLGFTSWDKTIDEDAILTHDNKTHAAALPVGAKGTYEECAAAKYGNFAVGKAILPKRLVCIETTDGHLALLRVLAKDTREGHWSVTVEATVWN
ncbi:hypothetical protein Cs7R123_13920 [Catellatospora sp. TT07R-123]|uniref:hypothetical protein n=1 Tax=Catellatospora sp. TT07R-123 TaxID=2733863 RepID=UPI001B011C95|nr:hypothetical protein [Catellatospora sp. TT07R-123]GHJ44050.1 hypothetical protein Cs7R123_13920 [Catellatospora sp. TT07R-123]